MRVDDAACYMCLSLGGGGGGGTGPARRVFFALGNPGGGACWVHYVQTVGVPAAAAAPPAAAAAPGFRQGLSLDGHFSAQPEPVLSLQPPNVSQKSAHIKPKRVRV